MDQSEGIAKDNRHFSSSDDEVSDDDTASQQGEGDRKIAAQPAIQHNPLAGQPRSTSQAKEGGALESNVGAGSAAGSAAGLVMRSTSDAGAAPRERAILEPSLHLDEIWRSDFGSVDLPAYVKKKATTISFPEKVSGT